jgi:uncharacterized caspase-like protein
VVDVTTPERQRPVHVLCMAMPLMLAFGLTGCTIAAGTEPAPQLPSASSIVMERSGPPTYGLGDRWIRNDGIYELIRIESDHYVYSAEPGSEIHLTKDLVPLSIVLGGNVQYEFTPPPALNWPLEVGKRGSIPGVFKRRYREEPYPVTLTWVVEAYEDVEVPAGKFKAFRISFSFAQRFEGARPSFWRAPLPEVYRFWYAPEVRRFVKSDGAWYLHFELIALDPEETAPLKVDLREPKDQARISGAGEAIVTGSVTGGKGVALLSVSLNGTIVSREAATVTATAKKAVVLHAPLKLREGKNVLIVTATDPAGVSTQEARTVFFDPPLSVALPQDKQQARIGQDEIVLRGQIRGPWPTGAQWYSLALNGRQIDQGDVAGKSDLVLSVPMKLQEGENLVTFRLWGHSLSEITEQWTLIFDKSAPAAPPQAVATASAGLSGKSEGASPISEPPPAALASPESAAPGLAPPRAQFFVPSSPPSKLSPGIPSILPADLARTQPSPEPAASGPPSSPVIVPSLPPSLQVRLLSPIDQARFEEDTVALAGLVSGNRGVSRVMIALNGAEISRQEERTAQRAIAVNLPVKLREGQNTLVVTASDTDGMVSQEVRTVHFEKRVPLTVAFRYPQDMARVTDVTTVVAAVVTSSKGVAMVSINLNGAEAHQQIERAPPKSLVVTVPLTLREGVNTIAITASEPDATVRQEIRTIVYNKSQAAVAGPAPSPPPSSAHNRWAVVIGVGGHDSGEIPKLRYSVPDAEGIYQVLTGVGGFKKEHVLLLTDKTERKPTFRNIRWALGTFLSRSARKDDTVVIFFAGHGAPESDPRGLERDGLAKYLIPSDADPEDLYSTAFPMDELQTIFGRIEAERVVAFLDTCYSGAAGGRTFLAKRTRSSQVDELFLERLTRSKGRAIITASRPAEVSMELAELGHGVFTYYLLEGLNGAADLNRDGIITVQELYEYVEQQVTQKSRSVGGNQHPVMKGELEGLLPLVKVRGK